MLRDLDKNTVDFYPNFDETLMQPAVLPARYPNLLVNGSNGIAVGMATNIPPHNLGEAVDACAAMIDNPDITIDELMNYIPGPDFPTGGVIMGDVGIRHAYFTGRERSLFAQRARSSNTRPIVHESSSRKFRIRSTKQSLLKNCRACSREARGRHFRPSRRKLPRGNAHCYRA